MGRGATPERERERIRKQRETKRLKKEPPSVRGQAFREMALEQGYDPAEKLIEMRKVLEVLAADPVLAKAHGLSVGKARQQLFELDRELMPYMHPKLKSSEVKLDATANLVDVLAHARKRRTQ